ncbi:MAG TPA: histidinol phosphate phosphatase [Enterococcus sp.]|nr:histidinol phosphate phosphatase [Enterococcus sp.]
MNYYDQHLHTFLSFDSEEQFENYLVNKPEFFVATDHFDLENSGTGFKDDIPDYAILTKKLDELNEQYDTTFLRGIELGVVPGQEAKIQDYLASHTYDLKLLSIHQNGKFDYMDDIVLTKDKFAVAKMYFDQMAEVLESFPDGHILTHFEYGLRRFDFTPEELESHFEKELIAIFKKVIQRELAMEINAKSFGRYQNETLYRYAIPLYQSLGGKLFTLGSDAHVAEDYRLLFSEMANLLREFDVKQLVVFQGNDRFYTDLP